MADEIIKEVRRAKDEIAAEFNYNIAALAANLKQKEQNGNSEKEYPSKNESPSALADSSEKHE